MRGSLVISGLLLLICSASVLGQKKKSAKADALDETILLKEDGISVTQNGNDNSLIVDQTPDSIQIKTNRKTRIIRKGSNSIVYSHSSTADSAYSSESNSVTVSQSGKGNRAVIKQSGNSNFVSVTQGPEKNQNEK